jgi:TPR repeat protein
MWPHHWERLIRQPAGADEPDPHRDARHLLKRATVISVPNAADEQELRDLQAAWPTDPRWAVAVEAARSDGKVIQVLGGGPYLTRRYDNATDPFEGAVLTAAIDAARLGHRGPIPLALLREAAPGYLTPEQRCQHHSGGRWFSDALSRAASKICGVSPLTLLRCSRPGVGEPDAVRLHDYLAQYGHSARRVKLIPGEMWNALIKHASDSGDRTRLADSAYDRGLLRIAAFLAAPAARAGNVTAMRHVWLALLGTGRRQDAALWEQRAIEADPALAWDRIDRLYRRGDVAATEPHLRRLSDADDADAIYQLSCLLINAGRQKEAVSWLRRATGIGCVPAWGLLREQGHETEADKLLEKAAASGHGESMSVLAARLEYEGRHDEACQWWYRMAESFSGSLFLTSRDNERAEAFLTQAAQAGNTNAMRRLARLYTIRRNPEAALPWLSQLAANGDREAMHDLPYALRNSGRFAEAEEFWMKRIEANIMREDAVHRLSDLYRAQGREADREYLLLRLAEHGDAEAIWCYHLFLADAGRVEESSRWQQRAADNGHHLALTIIGSELFHSGSTQDDEQWLRHTILACGGNTPSGLLYPLSAVLRRADKAEEAERLPKYGLEPDGTCAKPWDLES